VNGHFAITTNEVLRMPATISVPPQQLLERILTLEIVRVTERAAVSAARLRGQGNKVAADQAAVDAMRRELKKIPIDGTVVIGEGERDEAPMLFIGEKVGQGGLSIDIALDPLEGTTLTAKAMANALAVMAMAEPGTMLNAPDTYMDKIAIGPGYKEGLIDLDAEPGDNINAMARARGVKPGEITALVMDRPRHELLIANIRKAGAKVKLITDGDVAGVIETTDPATNVDIYIGIGGAPEGVLTAAAIKCLNGEIQARLVFDPDRLGVDKGKVPPAEQVIERLKSMGITDPQKTYDTDDLAPGKKIIFAATGVTDGALMRGVRFFGSGKRTHSLVMTTESKHIRFVDTVHIEGGPDTVIRF